MAFGQLGKCIRQVFDDDDYPPELAPVDVKGRKMWRKVRLVDLIVEKFGMEPAEAESFRGYCGKLKYPHTRQGIASLSKIKEPVVMEKHLTEPNPDLAAQIKRTPSGMAHWAGTGPAGKTCGDCAFLVSISVGLGSSTRCEKYTMMMRGIQGTKKIPKTTPACKYFDPQPHKR